MKINIRIMLPGDSDAVNGLSRQLGYPISLDQTKDCMANVLAIADHVAFVAIAEEKIIGWIHGFKTLHLVGKPFIEIGGLVVEKNYRNKKVGRKLVEQIIKWSINKNVAFVRVRSNVIRT